MSNLRQIILAGLIVLVVFAAVACGVASPAATSTLENIPLPTPTLAPTNSPLPAVTPTPENTPLPATPAAQGRIDVGGYKLAYECYGEGSPAVIVEAGGGDRPIITSSWSSVVQGVYPTTRICIYDRVSGVRTSQDIAEDLHVLLNQIHVTGPYILVGHSIGGYHVRVFAHLYPAEVAGMILVDTTNPDSLAAYATAYPTYSPNESASITVNRISDINAFPTPGIDGLDFNASTEQVRQAGSLGDLPLVVISQNVGPDDFLDLEPAVREQIIATVLKTQSDLAALSSRGVFKIANTSNHFISRYDPQIIVDAIKQMVEEIRTH